MIYKKWLGLACTAGAKIAVPECIKDSRQYFYQEIVKQLSLIFEKRSNPSTICKCGI